MFPDIYPHASASITRYDGFFSNKKQIPKIIFSPLCYPFSCIRFSYIPTSCTRLLHLTECSFPYFLHESRQLRIPEFSQSYTPHAKIKASRCQSLFTIGHKHMPCRQIGCPTLFCPVRILHRMYGDTAHQNFVFVLPASP